MERNLVLQTTNNTDERPFRNLVDNALIAIIENTVEGEILYTNQAAADIFEFASPDEMFEDGTPALWYNQQLRDAYIAELKENGSVNDYEIQVVTRTGKIVTLLSSATIEGNVISSMGVDITERKKAEHDLILRGEIMANMMESVHITRMEDGIIVFANPAMEREFGYEPNELLGKGVWTLNARTGRDPAEQLREYETAILEKGHWQGEILNVRKDRSTFWSFAKITSFQHPVHGRVSVTARHNITDLKQAAEDKALLLHDIGERFKELECMYAITNSIRTRNSIDEIFQDAVTAIPRGWESPENTRAKLRYGDLEWVSEPFEETQWRQSSDLVVAGKQCGSIEVYSLEPHGESENCCAEHPLLDTIAGTLSVAVESKIAEQALKDSEEVFRMIYEYAPIMIDAFDTEGRCVMWNKECEKVFGWTAEEMFAHDNPMSLFYPDADMQAKAIDNITANPVAEATEWHSVKKDGSEVICTWSNFRLPDGSIVNLGHDITKDRHSQQQLAMYQRRLKALAVKLTLAEEQERRRIAADLHDNVGQTLALTRLQLATARKDLDTNTHQDAQFDAVSQSLLRAIQDTRQLIFELSSPALNEFGLGAAITEWVEDQVKDKHALQVSVFNHAHDITLQADLRAILFRCVRELLTNAIKHSRAKNLTVDLQSAGDCLTITLEDDGIGFDANESLPNLRSQRGFGLFSVQERMSDLGGRFKLESRPGAGCKVELTMPVHDDNPGIEQSSDLT